MSIDDLCKHCDGYKEDCPKYYVVKAYSCYCEYKLESREKEDLLKDFFINKPKDLYIRK